MARGRVWKFGDNIATDLITPNTLITMSFPEMAKQVLKLVRPDFAPNVKPGDILVAGTNFGCSSGRTFAPKALKYTGIGAIVVESVSRTFYRNAHELGIGFVVCPGITEVVDDGDEMEVDTNTGKITDITKGITLQGKVEDGLLKDMIDNGGLIPLLESEAGEKYRKLLEE